MKKVFVFLSILVGFSVALGQGLPNSVSCRAYQPANKEFQFSLSNPPLEKIEGLDFPSNQRTLFRGAREENPQFNLDKIMRGLFRESHWRLSSPMMWGITQVLTGEWDLDHDFIPQGGLPLRMRDYFEARNILVDIEALMKCRSPKNYTKVEAEALAADLLNKMFLGMKRADINFRYLDLKNPDYYRRHYTEKGFGNKGVEFVTGTTYDQVASIYGNKVIVMQDDRNRGVDLGFWNFKRNQRWWDSWVDSGEINIPVNITADEVLGYQARKEDRQDSGWSDRMPNNPIDYAFYRIDLANDRAVLIVDGNEQLCMIHGSDRKLYFCSKKKWELLMESALIPRPMPESLQEEQRVSLIGVISTCGSPNCPVVQKAFSWYGRFSDRKIPDEIETQINAMTVNGKKLKVYYHGKSPNKKDEEEDEDNTNSDSDSQATGIEIVSASYLTATEIQNGKKPNVTAEVASYADGKDHVDYKVRYWRLGLTKVNNPPPREFRVEWKCAKNPKKILKGAIAAPAEGKTLTIDCR